MTEGVLIVDKPQDITSHDVVARCRRLFGMRQIGHTGTLDPFATGVMAVLLGQATRLARFIDKDEKEYEATVRFGVRTDTGDLTGEVITGSEGRIPAEDEVRAALGQFVGERMQTPPMYSAKKIDGRKLYEYARQGVEIERTPVPVNIALLEHLGASSECDHRLRVVCSAGTYVRVLAEEIGSKLEAGAHLISLRRIRSGRFHLSEAVSLEQLEQSSNREEFIRPLHVAAEHLPSITLEDDRIPRTRQGLSTRIGSESFCDGEYVRMLDRMGVLIAIGVYRRSDTAVHPSVVLM